MTGPLGAAPAARYGSALGECGGPLAAAHDALLLDLDGVIYVGDAPVAHAAESLAAARAAGARLVYVTNNASRRPPDVAAHLTRLGIPAAADEVATSAQAAVRVLADHLPRGARVLVLGTQALVEEVADGGFEAVPTGGSAGAGTSGIASGGGPVAPAAVPDVAAVVQGYGPGTSWADLAEAALAIRAGALWVACNRDSTLPSPVGPLPGNGALVAALVTATGLEPVVAGKPERALHAESVERAAARRPLVVGDRLDTDVEGAVRVGAASLLVLTGVVTWADLLAAPPGRRPTYAAHDLRALGEPQRAVSVEGPHLARCGSARASLGNGVLEVDGTGTDAVRAGCALAWALADAGTSFRIGSAPPSS